MYKYIPLILLALLLEGCGGSTHRDLYDYIEEIKSKPAGRIDEIPADPIYESFIYGSVSKRSPFDKPVDIQRRVFAQSGSDVKPDVNRVREHLEATDLGQLSMVGTVRKAGVMWALLSNAEDSGIYRVRKGNFIGKNHGKILSVGNTKIELIEIVSDGLDGYIERPQVLALVTENEE